MVSAKRRTDGSRSPGTSARLAILARTAFIRASVRVTPFALIHTLRILYGQCLQYSFRKLYATVPVHANLGPLLCQRVESEAHGSNNRRLGQWPAGHHDLQRIIAGDARRRRRFLAHVSHVAARRNRGGPWRGLP